MDRTGKLLIACLALPAFGLQAAGTVVSGLSAEATASTVQVGAAAALVSLDRPNPRPGSTQRGIGPTPACEIGVTVPAELTQEPAAPLPEVGGIFYTIAELNLWRERTQTGPFVSDGDYRPGSPGDWDRIAANTRSLLTRGEPRWRAQWNSDERRNHGTLARDAAFHFRMTGNAASLVAVRNFLVSEAINPANEFGATLCIRAPGGPTLDAHANEAAWLLRFIVTYDFVRATLTEPERLAVERLIRRNAYFLAAHLAFGLDQLFPNRQRGDYTIRRADAAPPDTNSAWWARRFDTNGDCRVDAADLPGAFPAYAYVRGDGVRGPRITAISQWFNNRRSTDVAAIGAAGLLLADAELVANAKRYVMEWLTFSVWPDGSQGEYARNGDYCVAGQGPIYGQANVQAAILLARMLERQGDRSLTEFETRDGLFGSASSSTPKSIEQAAATFVRLRLGLLPWYLDEPWKARPEPRPATALGNARVRFNAGASPMDDYHELGMLPLAARWPTAQIASLVLRDPLVTPLAFPGATGYAVPTGFGAWTDIFNAMPAMLLLRP